MPYIPWVALACSIVLFIWAAVRWRRTVAWSEEYAARRDMASLLLLLVFAVAGDRFRTIFPERSTPFLVISAVMLPLAAAAVFLVVRLAAAYRKSANSDRSGGPLHRE